MRLLDPNPALTDGARFTPDGKALVYPITQQGVDNLWMQPLDGSAGRQLTNFKSDQIFGVQFSPDGKNLAVLQRRIRGRRGALARNEIRNLLRYPQGALTKLLILNKMRVRG